MAQNGIVSRGLAQLANRKLPSILSIGNYYKSEIFKNFTRYIRSNCNKEEETEMIRQLTLTRKVFAPVARSAFQRAPFADQARWIGNHAKRQLALVDKLIAQDSQNGLTAATLWVEIVEFTEVNTDANKILLIGSTAATLWVETSTEVTTDAKKIKILHPELKAASSELARLLKDMYTFWVNNFYSCDQTIGSIGTTSAQFSAARRFTSEQIEQINGEAGIPYLGENLKNYADFLFFVFVGD